MLRLKGHLIGIIFGSGEEPQRVAALLDAINGGPPNEEGSGVVISTGGTGPRLVDVLRQDHWPSQVFSQGNGDGDQRPMVARVEAPQYLTPQLLRMDANSRKYQSTQKNWRRYDGTHFKKNKRIK